MGESQVWLGWAGLGLAGRARGREEGGVLSAFPCSPVVAGLSCRSLAI